MGFREELQKRVEKKRSEISALAGKLKEAEIYAQALEDTLKLLPKEDGGVSEAPAEIPLREGSNIAKAKEAIQKAGKPMHITELLAALGKPADKDARAALAGSLGAYVRRGEIFTRPGPNIFGLVGMKAAATLVDAEPPENFGLDGPEMPASPVDTDIPF
jgi:hypothetical protein